MLWQNKSYDLISYLEIGFGFIALICLISLLWLWYHPKYQNRFNSIGFLGKLIVGFDLYLLLDKIAHLLYILYEVYLQHLKYNFYDFILLGSDILLTIILIISTYLFIHYLNHLLKDHDKYMLKKAFKAYNCLTLIFIFKDVVLKIICDFLIEVRNISLHYHSYNINALMVTVVLMLLLGLVINFYQNEN